MSIKKCRECGAEVSTAAKACPKCGAKDPTKSVIDMIFEPILGIIVVIFILYYINAPSSSSPKTEATRVQVSDTSPSKDGESSRKVDAIAILRSKDTFDYSDLPLIVSVYGENQALFFKEVAGKSVATRIPFKGITKTFLSDDTFTVLAGSRLFEDFACYVPSEQAIAKLSALKKGDEILLFGKVKDVTIGTVSLSPCRVEK